MLICWYDMIYNNNNQNQRLMQPFQVYTRIRPLNERELVYGYNKKCVEQIDNQSMTVFQDNRNETIFQLDRVFAQKEGNQQIFQETVLPLANHFLNGINSTIFAYGITGAGKSYTMFGKKSEGCNEPGLIEIALQFICNELKDQQNYRLGLSYLQIYNEQVFDLFNPKSQNLQILDDPVSGVIVYDLKQIAITNSAHALDLIDSGNARRVIAETKANEFSSRSHAIVQLSLEKTVGDIVLSAKFSLVDLAGSQKQNVYSENKGIRNFQGSNINRSLLTLGNCINILSSKKSSFIPYRDSKLTRLLKDSLGGNTRTAMIACISPSIITFEQTLNTMKYACRARKIEKVVNQNIREQRSNDELKKELMKTKKQLQFYKQMNNNKGGQMSKQEMRNLLQQLINNTQNLTLLRVKQSNEFSDKIKQLELIDCQSTISNFILSKCAQQSQSIKPKQSRVLQNHNNNQITAYQHQKYKQHKQKPHQHVHTRLDQQEPSFFKGGAELKKGFLRHNLHNIREKNRQEKKVFKDLILNYFQTYDIQDIRYVNMQKAEQFLSKNREYLNSLFLEMLSRMIEGERLEGKDIMQFNIEQRRLKSDSDEIEEGFQPKHQNISSNRFLSSLQEIRKITKKITIRADAICQENYTRSCYDSVSEEYQSHEGISQEI